MHAHIVVGHMIPIDMALSASNRDLHTHVRPLAQRIVFLQGGKDDQPVILVDLLVKNLTHLKHDAFSIIVFQSNF